MAIGIGRRLLSRERVPALIVSAGLIALAFLILPLFDGIVLGTVFAYAGRGLRDLFGTRRRIGSLVASLGLVVPVSLIIALAVSEMISQIDWLLTHQQGLTGPASAYLSSLPIPDIVLAEMGEIFKGLIGIGAQVLAAVPVLQIGHTFFLGSLNFIISLPVCYFLLVDGHRLADFVSAFLPGPEIGDYQRYLVRIDRILEGVFLGSLYTAIAGGLSSVILFYFFDVPRPLALASVVFLAGLIPFMTWLVFIPTSLYRYYNHGLADALVFFVIGSGLVHLAELIIRPYFVSVKSSMHPLLVMVSFLGGGLVAGLGGFFLAPSLVGALVGVYQVRKEDLRAGRVDGQQAAEPDVAKG
ncbi:MAG: putative inner membrane protein [Methanosaeta sp. PtaB.Bin039]|nr:MAG: putative inner membrane protein [Methanosaeta sp. PtaB.Bin039]HOT06372.1 AI-2E family transporter [Methanotrichaceae archaeon]HQF16143.1 AI-2E family transporter [Methanotrichaceae archaeon]HQI90879.1 AI-2E family transporter [Methanotrichaceae archaeon]HQJ28301.1 AI-2E family transporter [Methanotrichaceae archaeon]